MSAQHTPGPWIIRGQDIIGSGKNGFICTWSGTIADARLITAALDLLQLAYAIVSYCEDDSRSKRRRQAMINSALEVIEKARGTP